MAHPESYTAFGFVAKDGPLERLTMPWSNPKAGHVVVKVLACGICAGDTIPQRQHMPVSLPRVPGHELVGEIVAIHPQDAAFKVGDLVGSGWHGGHCFACNECRVGNFVGCSNGTINGVLQDGGFAEYVTLRSEALCRVPAGLDVAVAAPLLCAGVTTFNSLRNMHLNHGELVAVQGIGGLGHLGIQFARKMGYRVIALSSGPAKREISLQLGAFAYLDGSAVDQAEELQKLGGAKVIMACAPDGSSIRKLVSGLANDGTLLVLGDAHDDLAIPAHDLIIRRLTVRGWPCGTPKDCEDTLAFARDFDVKTIVETFPLEKAQEAYDRLKVAKYRVVLTPHSH